MLYSTLLRAAEAEQTIERSRFIAYVQPVADRLAADAFFETIRSCHRDARHCVPAFILGEKSETKWSSDDGEPQGTAGQPLLKLLEGEGLTFAAIMVVRYFGGIKLGPGGLSRAYSGTARLAVDAAGRAQAEELERLTIRVDYRIYERLNSVAKERQTTLDNPIFLEKVQTDLLYPIEQAETVEKWLNEESAGQFENLGKQREISLRPVEIKLLL